MDLERAFTEDVIAHPEDDTPRLVFADWLDDRGDAVRAEFIRLQVAIAGGGPSPAMLQREEQLVAENLASWAADLHGIAHEVLFRRGFVEGIELAERRDGLGETLAAWSRRYPLRLLRLDELGDEANLAAVALVEDGRLDLESLDIDMEDEAPCAWMDRLWQSPRAASLRSLLIEHESGPEEWERLVERIAAAPGPLANLRELGLGFGTVSDSLAERALEALIASMGFPNLEKLHVPFSRFGTEAAAMLGASRCWQRLTHLDLGCCYIPQDGWRRFARGPNAARLQWLGLIGAHVVLDEGWDTLHDHECGHRLVALLGEKADYNTSATFPRWKGVRV